jgi:hypothetical protein
MSQPFPIPLATPPPPTMTLAHLPSVDAVKVSLDIPSGVTRLWVWRVSPSGATEFVRGAVDLLVGGTSPGASLDLYDFEAPLGVELDYYARSGNDAGETSSPDSTATITIPTTPIDDPWLVDIAQPGNTQRIVVGGIPELLYAVRTGVHDVIGRRAPIVTSDFASTPAFELTFVTYDDAARERARQALGNGIPVLLRTPVEQGVGSMFLVTLEWAEQRVSRLALHAERRFRVSARQVDRPDAKLFVPTTLVQTYAGVRSEFDDYADVDARNASYEALLVTYGGASSAAPWPKDDA